MQNGKTKKETTLTAVGLILMAVLTAAKVITESKIIAAALIVVGIAFFFVVEAVAKTIDQT